MKKLLIIAFLLFIPTAPAADYACPCYFAEELETILPRYLFPYPPLSYEKLGEIEIAAAGLLSDLSGEELAGLKSAAAEQCRFKLNNPAVFTNLYHCEKI